MNFAKKVVLVTGASSGIGAATAKLFAKKGANVVLVGRNKEKLMKTATECIKTGNEPLQILADVTEEEAAKRLVNETVQKFGKINVFVNNAGIMRSSSIFDINSMEIYDSIMKINLRAPIFMTHLIVPHLIKSKGNIINISSIEAKIIQSHYVSYYGVSKAALDHFTRGAATELAPHGVRVNLVSPGFVKTDIVKNAGYEDPWEGLKETTLLKRVSEPEEIADLVVFLASDKAKGITGSDFVSDNGTILCR